MADASGAPHDPTVAVSGAFDQHAVAYDAREATNPILQWMRSRVQQQALRLFPPGSHVLEIGCGTGSDTLFFLKHGYRVHATDPAAGMLARARDKVTQLDIATGGCNAQTGKPSTSVQFTQLGAENLPEYLAQHSALPFDAIFSNFGAINCLASLQPLRKIIASHLRPGGRALFCFMPPLCLWEVVYFLLRGRPADALRRWHGRTGTGGIDARLDGATVRVHYHCPRALRDTLRAEGEIIRHYALGLIMPPPYLSRLAARKPLFQTLDGLDRLLASLPLLRNLGDHVILVLRKAGSDSPGTATAMDRPIESTPQE